MLTVAQFQLTHGLQEQEACSVVALWIFPFHLLAVTYHSLVVIVLKGIVGNGIDGILYLLAIASLELKVGIGYQLAVLIVWVFCYQPLPIVFRIVAALHARIELEHVVIEFVGFFEVGEVQQDALESPLCQWKVLHAVFIDDGRTIQSLHQSGIRLSHLIFRQRDVLQIILWPMRVFRILGCLNAILFCLRDLLPFIGLIDTILYCSNAITHSY